MVYIIVIIGILVVIIAVILLVIVIIVVMIIIIIVIGLIVIEIIHPRERNHPELAVFDHWFLHLNNSLVDSWPHLIHRIPTITPHREAPEEMS